VHQVSPGVPLGRCHVQVSQVSSPGGAVSTRCPPGSQVFHCRRCHVPGVPLAGVVSRWCSVHQVSSRQSGVPLSRCPLSHRCSLRQVSRPGVAGVVTQWCRLAPSSPEGAGRLQAPQKVQAGSNLPRRCRQVLLSPEGVGRCPQSRRCSVRQVSRSGWCRCRLQVVQCAPGVSRQSGVPLGRCHVTGGAGVVYRWCRVHQVSPGNQVFR
jgi:hypothetical protein